MFVTGIKLDEYEGMYDEDSGSVTPVFQTQVMDDMLHQDSSRDSTNRNTSKGHCQLLVVKQPMQ